jgi:hypothetical protein
VSLARAVAMGLAPVLLANAPLVEPFLLANYVVRSDTYGREPGHRFRALWVSRTQSLVDNRGGAWLATDLRGRRVRWLPDVAEGKPWSPVDPVAFDALVREVTTCAPELAGFSGDVFPSEIVEFPRGRVVSFYIRRQAVANNPLQAFFLSSMVLQLDGRCLSLGEVPRDFDVETDSVSRTFWDIVSFRGDEYVVISRHGYEHAELEAYRVEGSRLTLVLQRYIGGL